MNRRLALGTILVAGTLFAQTPTPPPLQKGIAVVLAATRNATAFPEADDADAWIVAITFGGDIFFGSDEKTPNGLLDAMTRTPRRRGAKLYIKADRRAPFATVQRVLEIGKATLFETQVLLTSQPEASQATLAPPTGLEVSMGSAPPGARVVQLIAATQGDPELKIDDESLPWSALDGALPLLMKSDHDKVVVVKADGALPFSSVAHVVDLCRGLGAKVFLPARGGV